MTSIETVPVTVNPICAKSTPNRTSPETVVSPSRGSVKIVEGRRVNASCPMTTAQETTNPQATTLGNSDPRSDRSDTLHHAKIATAAIRIGSTRCGNRPTNRSGGASLVFTRPGRTIAVSRLIANTTASTWTIGRFRKLKP
jgi:hypothetical protein